jgi:hypothetical protein
MHEKWICGITIHNTVSPMFFNAALVTRGVMTRCSIIPLYQGLLLVFLSFI